MKTTSVAGIIAAMLASVSAVATQKRADGVEYTAVKTGDTVFYGEAVCSDPNHDTLALLTRTLRPTQMVLSAPDVSDTTDYAQLGTVAAMHLTVVISAATVVQTELAARETMVLSLAKATE